MNEFGTYPMVVFVLTSYDCHEEDSTVILVTPVEETANSLKARFVAADSQKRYSYAVHEVPIIR